MRALSRRAKGFATSAIRWPHRSRNPLWASARRYSARQRHSSRSSRRASWSSLRWANRAFRVWSSASTTRRRVKSEGCDLTSGVAVASDMGGSSRAKVIGALKSLIGGLAGRALAGPKVLQGSRLVFKNLPQQIPRARTRAERMLPPEPSMSTDEVSKRPGLASRVSTRGRPASLPNSSSSAVCA